MRTLITGGNGLIGSHLALKLLSLGDEVCLIARKESKKEIAPKYKLHYKFGDITDPNFIYSSVYNFQPERVFHFAAQSLPSISAINSNATLKTNIEGTNNLLSSISDISPNTLVLITGSSAEYGQVFKTEKIKENFNLEPSTVYGISKLAGYHLTRFFINTKKLKIIYTRPFFVIGTGKIGDVSHHFAQSIVRIENKESKTLKHGNLEPIRDFIDIDDCINGLLLLSESGKSGEVYNICSGEGVKIRDLLNEFCKNSKFKINTEIDKKHFRDVDELIRLGDPTKLELLGWRKKVSIEQSVKKIINYWRINR